MILRTKPTPTTWIERVLPRSLESELLRAGGLILIAFGFNWLKLQFVMNVLGLRGSGGPLVSVLSFLFTAVTILDVSAFILPPRTSLMVVAAYTVAVLGLTGQYSALLSFVILSNGCFIGMVWWLLKRNIPWFRTFLIAKIVAMIAGETIFWFAYPSSREHVSVLGFLPPLVLPSLILWWIDIATRPKPKPVEQLG